MGYFIYISVSIYLPFYLFSKFDAASRKEQTKASNYAHRFYMSTLCHEKQESMQNHTGVTHSSPNTGAHFHTMKKLKAIFKHKVFLNLLYTTFTDILQQTPRLN